jgi:hypothetical protein
MSNLHTLRKEKNCLNCGAEVKETYCGACGQLNREPQLTLKDLMHEMLHSILHFDGKFFETIKVLITKPGFLTTEYIAGKRSKYLPPVQMYLFTSAIFFFLLYTFFLKSPSTNENWSTKENQEINQSIKIDFTNDVNKTETIQAYHQQQSVLKPEKRDGIIKRYFKEEQIKLNNKFKENPRKTFTEFFDNFIHGFSSLFFISLPLIAIWLNILFYNKKEINLVGHFIFITHNYIVDYIIMLINIILKVPAKIKGLEFMETIAALVMFWMLYYGYASMNKFYQLSRRRAIFMYTLTLVGSLFIFALLVVVFFILSISKI